VSLSRALTKGLGGESPGRKKVPVATKWDSKIEAEIDANRDERPKWRRKSRKVRIKYLKKPPF
jgi:hypothetical protein